MPSCLTSLSIGQSWIEVQNYSLPNLAAIEQLISSTTVQKVHIGWGFFYISKVELIHSYLYDLFCPSDRRHVDWVGSYLSVWTEMQAFIKEHHITGLVWSKAVSVIVLPERRIIPKCLYFKSAFISFSCQRFQTTVKAFYLLFIYLLVFNFFYSCFMSFSPKFLLVECLDKLPKIAWMNEQMPWWWMKTTSINTHLTSFLVSKRFYSVKECWLSSLAQKNSPSHMVQCLASCVSIFHVEFVISGQGKLKATGKINSAALCFTPKCPQFT